MNNNDNFNNNNQITNFNVIPNQPTSNVGMGNTPANQNNGFVLGTVDNTSHTDTVGIVTSNESNNSQVQANVNNNQPIPESNVIPNANVNTNPNQVNIQAAENPNPIITDNNAVSNLNNQENTMINSLNVDGTYNQVQAPDYVNDPTVQENIQGQKKNTITITKELKTVIIIALVLLVFIIVMPIIFDLINGVRFR